MTETEKYWREDRIGYLQDIQAKLAAIPDQTQHADLSCASCGVALSVTRSPRRPVYLVFHPAGDCAEAGGPNGRYRHVPAESREQAIARFRAEVSV